MFPLLFSCSSSKIILLCKGYTDAGILGRHFSESAVVIDQNTGMGCVYNDKLCDKKSALKNGKWDISESSLTFKSAIDNINYFVDIDRVSGKSTEFSYPGDKKLIAFNGRCEKKGFTSKTSDY